MSCTTRPKRSADRKDEYRFYNQDSFEQIRDFLWRREIHGHSYGTREGDLLSALRQRPIVSIVVSVDTIFSLNAFCETRNILHLALYLLSPSPEELAVRLINRGEDEITVRRRVNECKEWDMEARSLDFVTALLPMTVFSLVEKVMSLIREKQKGSGLT